jgi:orotidine-5'-phosphate decarboxylase
MSQTKREDARRRLILALDVPNIQNGIELLERVKGQVGVVKVGLELFTADGPKAVEEVRKRGFEVFLDLKLHDIPNTVRGAVRAARGLEVSMLTLHAAGGERMISEAADGQIKLLGVTLLTSMDIEDLDPVGILADPVEVVRRRAVLSAKAGCAGIVCSPKEIREVSSIIDKSMIIVTPGIRPRDSAMGDQKRAATPEAAITAGADYLVVGRPISAAGDPAAQAGSIVDSIAKAIAEL